RRYTAVAGFRDCRGRPRSRRPGPRAVPRGPGDRRCTRVRVLFLTHRLPYAPNRGDRIRAHHLLRFLSTIADVDLVSLVHDDEEASHEEETRSLAATVTTFRVPRLRNLARSVVALAGHQPLTHTLLDAPTLSNAVAQLVRTRPPDVVLAYCSGMAR